MIKTEIGTTTMDEITVRGRSLAGELIGQIDFVDMILIASLGRPCQGAEKEVINTILVTVCDHGLTPSALAARLTYMGAPEAPQAAVAAGLLGAGSVFLGAMQNAAEMLQDAAEGLDADATDEQITERAREFVSARRAARAPLYGLGHNIHLNGDPRIPALRGVAERTGTLDVHWKLLLAMDEVSGTIYSRRLPANTAGAVGAMVLSLGLPLHMARGLALIGRCAGLLGHIIEEQEHPIGQELWDLVLRQDDRNQVPGKFA